MTLGWATSWLACRGLVFRTYRAARLRSLRNGWGAGCGRHQRRLARLGTLQFFQVLGHVGHADILAALALGHDAVVEGDIGTSAMKFVDFKAGGGLLAYIKTLAFAFGREVDVILDAGVDGLSEVGVKLDAGCAAG